MINHVSIGVRDLAAAQKFYDAALSALGYSCLVKFEGALGYGGEAADFWLLTSTSPVAPDEHSGLHFCFTAPTRKSVDAFYQAALGAGGRDNGEPGLRSEYGDDYYAAFVTDPDGYRLEAYCSAPA